MNLRSLGALPGSQLHPSLTVAFPRLKAILGELQGEATKAEARLLASATLDYDFGAIVAKAQAAIDIVASITASLPGLKVAVGGRLEADIDIVFGLIADLELQLGKLEAAIGIGGMKAWSWTGTSRLFGPRLAAATAGGFGTIGPDTNINALILSSSSAAQWATLGTMLAIGGSDVFSAQYRGTPAAPKGKLTDLGFLPGTSLCAGAALTVPALVATLTFLGAKLIDLQASFAALFSLVVTVDPVTFALGLGAFVSGFAGVVVGWPGINIDLNAAIKAGAVLALEPVVATLALGLSGGGIQAWAYDGPAGQLGSAFATETVRGIAGGTPGDHAYGLVLASDNVSDWASLSGVLKVA